MKLVVSNTGEPFRFTLNRNTTYSFDPTEPTEIGETDLATIRERIGNNCLLEVAAPKKAAASAASEEDEGEGKEEE